MSRNPEITVPLATNEGNCATLALRWLVQRAEYDPEQATFKPLVNGAEAFSAVYDAIAAAKRTVDIICWGFQPSMYFKRGADGKNTLPIGELLEKKGKEGVKIRLLVWTDSLNAAQFVENMTPGNNVASYRGDTRSSLQRKFDREWYRRANLNNVTKLLTNARIVKSVVMPAAVAAELAGSAIGKWVQKDKALTNIEFATRDFDLRDRAEIAWRSWVKGAYADRTDAEKGVNAFAMSLEPSHHQKMVLVDYEDIERAVGFVMGHNTLDEYWDTDDHSCYSSHPQMGRNGEHPRQDISSRVTGPILRNLNTNFCQAWDDATGRTLAQARKEADAATMKSSARRDFDTPVMAQILRTQPQHTEAQHAKPQHAEPQTGKGRVRDIERMYLQAVNNTTNFIYIENQYFRFPPLVEKLKELIGKYKECKRDDPLYLFVVTNASEGGIGPGTFHTFRMLQALGRADTISGIARLERTEALKRQYEAVRIEKVGPGAPAEARRATLEDLKRQIRESENAPVLEEPIEGLKVHVCSLVAPNSPAGKPWEFVYIHSKLMIVDDVFMTLGSANINTRSMMVDSELNICHEHMDVTQPLRERLWGIHTKGLGVGQKSKSGRLDAAHAFERWGEIIDINSERIADEYKESPYASLVEFNYTGTKRSYWD